MDDIGNALSRIDSDKALLRILLVEDDEDDYVIIRDLLSGIEKFALEWVSDHGTALRAIEHEEHDVCLLDYRLGERSGLELLHEASKRGYKAPIILLTGQGGREVDLEATQAGARRATWSRGRSMHPC
jgi:DNA-binding response OmpR family regulator